MRDWAIYQPAKWSLALLRGLLPRSSEGTKTARAREDSPRSGAPMLESKKPTGLVSGIEGGIKPRLAARYGNIWAACNNTASGGPSRKRRRRPPRKVFSWKPRRARSALEIKSLAYEGGARNGAYRLSRISMRDYCPRGWPLRRRPRQWWRRQCRRWCAGIAGSVDGGGCSLERRTLGNPHPCII